MITMYIVIAAIVYAIIGIGTSKLATSHNSGDPLWDAGAVFFSGLLWPFFLIISAFWNFK